MTTVDATVYREEIELRHAVRASGERHATRARLYVSLRHEGSEGFGEVSPQPHALHGDPGEAQVRSAIERALARVREVTLREGDVPHWARASRLGDGRGSDNVAYALIEMALLDRDQRRHATSIRDLWEPVNDTPVQSTVSVLDDEPWEIDERAARVRVKCAPGSLGGRAIQRLVELNLPVLLDFNCSATNDAEVLELLDAVSRVANVEAIEQPYAVGNVVDHAQLARQLAVPLSLDEGVRSLRDLHQIVRYRAAQMICVKPARVGGLANARTLIGRAEGLGLRAYLGGFFESPYARAVHRALADSCVREPSDLGEVVVRHPRPAALVNASFGREPSLEGLPVVFEM